MIRLDIESGTGPRRIDLFSYLEPADEERAQEDAYAWIKAVRHLRVDGQRFRSRFTLRGDSLWWFAELYLNKQQAILTVLRALSAFATMADRERPLAVTCEDRAYGGVIAQAAAARRIRYAGAGWPSETGRLLRMEARASALAAAARLSRLRAGRADDRQVAIAAFVHRAFWRSGVEDGSAESYIGPVLRELEAQVGPPDIRYVGVGPRSNFRARRWWDPIAPEAGAGSVPVERYAPWPALAAARALYRERHAIRRAMWGSADLREHAVIRGCDCWPLVRHQLAGIALLQFTWSARAMDEAAAALDRLRPKIAVTYAEAGGWGRALALECRRRGVPLAGLQHGFIYRHWLNYRHEPDEAQPDPDNASDRGFPFPASTLLFDERTADHLTSVGRFPPSALQVTGSPRLDEMQASIRALAPDAVDAARQQAGAAGRALVVFAAKEREARRSLPALIAAVRAMPDVQLAIKPHPAETPEVYASAVSGAANVSVLPASAALAPLLAAAQAIVTVNSTVAIDGLTLGVPSLVIGLPNNLTPFVDAGLMAGGRTEEEIRDGLARVLYDQEFRSRIQRSRGTEGGRPAAARSAEAILRMTGAK
ncbi:MAG TPA: hypothetical protein VFK57_12125 [Vicinamibacterales bacterium]|nr:hypothetical protein [Vicinamibacterales bacterium]